MTHLMPQVLQPLGFNPKVNRFMETVLDNPTSLEIGIGPVTPFGFSAMPSPLSPTFGWSVPYAANVPHFYSYSYPFAPGVPSTFGGVSWGQVNGFGSTNIFEKNGQLFYETELPGIRKEDLDIRVEGQRLVITAEAKRDEAVHETNYLSIGRQLGKIQRVFLLPEQVKDLHLIEAQLSEGVLKIVVPLQNTLKNGKALKIKAR